MDVVRTGSPTQMPWWVILLQGIAAVIIGILLLTETSATIFTLVVLLGIYFLVAGVFDLIGIFVDSTAWGWKLFTGVLGVIAGIVILRHPYWSATLVPLTLTWILGGIGVVMGLVQIFRGIRGAGWGAGLLGLVTLVLGVLLLLHPVYSTVVLAWVLGAWAIVGGVVGIFAAFRLRSPQRAAAGRGPDTTAGPEPAR
ncbi:MAG TPA: DUF308 domain-containing protein [Candidatus Binatia bacterium]|nr:DUF308 domain-containing protein [Candidatus Binatia bacterium]